MYRSHVLICGGTGCTSSNSEKIIEKMKEEIKARGLENEVNVVRTGCFGLCALGPIMIVYPEGAFYSMVKVEDVPEIVEEHLLKGRIVKRLLYQETVQKDDTIKSLNETAFYAAVPQGDSSLLRVEESPCGTAASSTRRTSTST